MLELLNPNFFPAADFSNLHLVGFSQGAALSYTFGLLQPKKLHSLAGLSGFPARRRTALYRWATTARQTHFYCAWGSG